MVLELVTRGRVGDGCFEAYLLDCWRTDDTTLAAALAGVTAAAAEVISGDLRIATFYYFDRMCGLLNEFCLRCTAKFFKFFGGRLKFGEAALCSLN